MKRKLRRIDGIVGNHIAHFRQRAGVDVRGLAAELGLSLATLARIETGQTRAGVDVIAHLAELFEQPVVAFFDDSVTACAPMRDRKPSRVLN
jgi:transcriptional regulator with XRE-family HTH domain